MGGKDEGADSSKKYMLDTNVFNHVLDEQITLDKFMGKVLFATHVQHDELERTLDPDRRKALLSIFHQIEAEVIPTETAIWGDSKWGRAKWSNGDGLYEKLLARIKELDGNSRRNKSSINQSRDARIAETAIRQRLILVTNDNNLKTAATENHCQVIDGIIK